MKTAMTELIDRLKRLSVHYPKSVGLVTATDIANELLEKEKEQILQAYMISGINNIDKKKLPNLDLDYFKICANEYFLRNYKQNK